MKTLFSALFVCTLLLSVAGEVRAAPPKDQGLMLCTSQKIRGNWRKFERINFLPSRPEITSLVDRYFQAQLRDTYDSGHLQRVQIPWKSAVEYMQGDAQDQGKEGEPHIYVYAYLDTNYKYRPEVKKHCGEACMRRELFETFDACYLAWPMKVCLGDNDEFGKRC